MNRKLSIIAYKQSNQWILSVETKQGLFVGRHLHYSISTKKSVVEYCKYEYPLHKVHF